jgi:uncharacterized integral membrane protein
MVLLKILLAVVVLILAVTFSYFNTQEVDITLMDYSLRLPLFSVVIGSFILGGIVPTLVYTLRNAYLRRRISRMEEALRNLWLGFNLKASSMLRKLASGNEIFFPLFLISLPEVPDRYRDKSYTLGIAETYMAERLIRKDRVRATELLEQALGKNWENLRAKGRLRDLYTLFGELEKALDLQREILKEADKREKKFNERIMSALESVYLLGVEEYDKTPKLKLSAEFFFFSIISAIESGDRNRASRLFEEAVSKGYGNEVVDMLMNAKRLEPSFVEFIDREQDRISQELLCRLYIKLGMFEKAQDLKPKVSKLLSLMVDLASSHRSEDRNIFNLIKGMYTPWECISCGKRHHAYRFICDNCLEWFNIKLIEER